MKTETSSKPIAAARPKYRMRVKFWGVQGSCPSFPRPQAVAEYARRVAVETLKRAVMDLASSSPVGADLVEAARTGKFDPQCVEEYQRRIGLPDLPVYGGETTCIQIDTADGHVIFIDGGSGIRPAAREIVMDWPDNKPRRLHFFASHEHLDHRSGLPFSQFCFARPEPFTLNIYGSHGFLSALDERFGVYSREIRKFTHLDDPLDFRMMSAVFTGTELRNPEINDWEAQQKPLWNVRDVREPIQIGQTTVKPFDVYHGSTRCLAYEVTHGDAKFVFCTDHELRHGGPDDSRRRQSEAAERRLRERLMNADVAYLDGQYFRREYDGLIGIGVSPALPRLDWGHSCIEDCLERVMQCRVKRCYIGHHDPERDWDEQVRIDQQLAQMSRGQPFTVQLASAHQVVEI